MRAGKAGNKCVVARGENPQSSTSLKTVVVRRCTMYVRPAPDSLKDGEE